MFTTSAYVTTPTFNYDLCTDEVLPGEYMMNDLNNEVIGDNLFTDLFNFHDMAPELEPMKILKVTLDIDTIPIPEQTQEETQKVQEVQKETQEVQEETQEVQEETQEIREIEGCLPEMEKPALYIPNIDSIITSQKRKRVYTEPKIYIEKKLPKIETIYIPGDTTALDLCWKLIEEYRELRTSVNGIFAKIRRRFPKTHHFAYPRCQLTYNYKCEGKKMKSLNKKIIDCIMSMEDKSRIDMRYMRGIRYGNKYNAVLFYDHHKLYLPAGRSPHTLTELSSCRIDIVSDTISTSNLNAMTKNFFLAFIKRHYT